MHVRAANHLRSSDPRLGEWIDRLGIIKLPARRPPDPYLALLQSIAYQQLAGSAARAIWGRVLGLFEDGRPHPERLIALSEAHLRSAGLSRNKTLYMKDIADKALAGHVPDAKQIAKMTDKEIYDRLTQIRGVGPWTVDMLLIFTLRRPDILPSSDYGVRKGFQVLYRKRALPSPKLLLKTAELWRPYRTTAALYLWRIADSAKQAKSLLK
jgi:3-methyladenine DNA glycosylase/8-oxoguanine DNA glycosylase